MPEKSSYFAESNAGAYLLFLGALALFLITWTVLQSAVGLHLTAAGSQFVAILGAALVFRVIMGSRLRPGRPSVASVLDPGRLLRSWWPV